MPIHSLYVSRDGHGASIYGCFYTERTELDSISTLPISIPGESYLTDNHLYRFPVLCELIIFIETHGPDQHEIHDRCQVG